ncbi:MAG: class I SAM-dependent methyltransferase [Rhodomicrobium sp.]
MSLVNREPNRLAIDVLSLEPTDRVVELGFGSGSAIKTMASLVPEGSVLGIDQSPEMLAQASGRNKLALGHGRVRLHLGGFNALPCDSCSIDKILAVNVVYFFRADAAELREAHRVLRPGGLMAIYATHRSTMLYWKFAASDTHTLFDEAELRSLILRGGFPEDSTTILPIVLPFGIQGLLAVIRKN